MDPALQKTLNLFVENTAVLDSAFRFQKAPSKQSSALLFTLEDKKANREAIIECSKTVKSHTSLFSRLRTVKLLSLSTYLSFSSNSEKIFSDSCDVYRALRKELPSYWFDSLSVAAIMIAAASKPENCSAIVQRCAAIYHRTKRKGLFVMQECNVIFISLLALSSLELNSAIGMFEELYTWLKDERSVFGLADLAMISALTGEGITAAARALKMSSLVDGIGFPKSANHATLNVYVDLLTLVHSKPELLLQDINDAHSFMQGQKGSSLCTARYHMLYFASIALVTYHHSRMENGGVPSPLAAAIVPAISLNVADAWF
ncbi:MAG: DUF4003 domain-containing protein [Clostridiales bacterium]|jgi:hypothetical protein|nr:DUF4003 domain-containing protein [Clostridiales bacterium]